MARSLCMSAVALMLGASIWAQSSASYRVEEHTLNQGGNPAEGAILLSDSFRMTLDAVGDSVGSPGPSSAGFKVDTGPETVRPPGEVLDLLFSDTTGLFWDVEPSVGVYNLYRALRSDLPGAGACLARSLVTPAGSDPETPPPGVCWFYLVTAENRLGEEGPTGSDSTGAPRPNPSPCP